MKPWYGVDFDGTLAEYGTFQGASHCGAPIPKMVERVKGMFTAGLDVRIFTARVYPLLLVNPNDNIDQVLNAYSGTLLFGRVSTPQLHDAVQATIAIQKWCYEHLGRILPITCVKDYGMVELYDDRAKQVIKNTGILLEESVGAGKHAFSQG